MRKALSLLGIGLLSFFMLVTNSLADSVDEHIKNLKNSDPEIRAKAAFELGCS